MIKRALSVFFLLSGCSSGDDVKIDYTVTYTDGAGRDNGVVESGSFSTIQSSAPGKMLMFSMATFDIKSDMNGLHFTIAEDTVRRGALSCISQVGSSAASASANLSAGGHYLITVNAKGAHCIAEQ
jgi:hypothetical protein